VLGPHPNIADHLIAVVLLIALFLAAMIMVHLVGEYRRQMEAELNSRTRAEQVRQKPWRESKAQWKEVFEHNPVMYFMGRCQRHRLSVNTFGAAQLGYLVGELRGQSVLKVFFEKDRDLSVRAVDVWRDIGRTHSWEIRKVRKDGSALWVVKNAKACDG